MIDNSLKCTEGENFIEVEKRMDEVIRNIVKNNIGKKVAIVSHGAAIKYYLKKYCDFRNNKLLYKEKEVKIDSPSILKLEFEGIELEKILFI